MIHRDQVLGRQRRQLRIRVATHPDRLFDPTAERECPQPKFSTLLAQVSGGGERCTSPISATNTAPSTRPTAGITWLPANRDGCERDEYLTVGYVDFVVVDRGPIAQRLGPNRARATKRRLVGQRLRPGHSEQIADGDVDAFLAKRRVRLGRLTVPLSSGGNDHPAESRW